MVRILFVGIFQTPTFKDSFVSFVDKTDYNITDPHLSRKSKAECLSCGGEPTYPFTWRKGKWVAGVPVTPQWRCVLMLKMVFR
jgi:hypothetical protein